MNNQFQFNVRTLLEITAIFAVAFAVSPITSIAGAILLSLAGVALIARQGVLAIGLLVMTSFAAELTDVVAGREMAYDYSGYVFANFIFGCLLIAYVRIRRWVQDGRHERNEQKKLDAIRFINPPEKHPTA